MPGWEEVNGECVISDGPGTGGGDGSGGTTGDGGTAGSGGDATTGGASGSGSTSGTGGEDGMHDVSGFDLPFEATNLDFFDTESGSFADGTVLVVGPDAAAVYDPETGTRIGSELPVGGYGGVWFEFEGTEVGYAVVTHGPDGMQITQWNEDVNDFGGTFQFGVGNVTGLQKIPGSPGHVVYTNNSEDQIGVLGPNGTTLSIAGSSVLYPNIFSGVEGHPVSAFAHEADGKVIVVYEGAEATDPGTAWLADFGDSSAPAVKIGDVGIMPRMVRCDATLCAVSNFGSNTFSIFSWSDHSMAPTNLVELPGAEEPVFLDLGLFDGKHYLVSGDKAAGVIRTFSSVDGVTWVADKVILEASIRAESARFSLWPQDGSTPRANTALSFRFMSFAIGGVL